MVTTILHTCTILGRTTSEMLEVLRIGVRRTIPLYSKSGVNAVGSKRSSTGAKFLIEEMRKKYPMCPRV